jgi:hypothetical protein
LKNRLTAPVSRVLSSGREINQADILRLLSNSTYDIDNLADYADRQLQDAGIEGGIICFIESAGKLCIAIEYWFPRQLTAAELRVLIEYTRTQLTDGIGEGGFEIRACDAMYIIVPDQNAMMSVETVDDGKRVAVSELWKASRAGDLEAAMSAAEKGEDVNASRYGYAPIHLAVLFGHEKLAKFLLALGADSMKHTKFGDAPLHLCATSRLQDIESKRLAVDLVSHGATDTLDREGRTAAQIAELRKKSLLANYLNDLRSR